MVNKAPTGPLFSGPEARPDNAHPSFIPVGSAMMPNGRMGPWGRRHRACSSRLAPRYAAGFDWLFLPVLADSPVAAWGRRSAFLAQNIERAGERKVWSRLAQQEGGSIGAQGPIAGVLRPLEGCGTFLLFHPPHGASREMQMTRLSPLCRGDKDFSCRFHNS